jgi:hypothetical protein
MWEALHQDGWFVLLYVGTAVALRSGFETALAWAQDMHLELLFSGPIC